MLRRTRALVFALLGLALVVAVVLVGTDADAFVVKATGEGEPVRWTASRVTFTLDPSLDAVPGAATAARSAAAAWSGRAGAPRAQVAVGKGAPVPAAPAVDRVNTVLASDAFAGMGHALAVTVLSYDEDTGEILDADIVLDTTALASASYDVERVLAHEIGHAFGLGDDPDAPESLMYPYAVAAGDATPTDADLAGIRSLYAESALVEGPSSGASARGCTSAAAPRGSSGAAEVGALVALVGIAGARRRRRGHAM